MKFLREVMQLSADASGEESQFALHAPALFASSVTPPDPANAVLVVDLGSANTTFGWAGEQRPVRAIPTAVLDKRPIEKGFIRDFVLLEEIFKQIFKITTTDPAAYPLVVTVAPKTANSAKQKLAKMLFDKFKVPSLLLVTSAYSDLCSTEHLSGLVLSIGGGVTHATPIYETVTLQHGITRSDVAGNDLTELLIKPLTAKGHLLSTEQVNHIKESICYIAKDYDGELKAGKESGKPFGTAFLDDGRQFPVGDEVISTAEVLFRPSLIKKEAPGVAELVKRAIGQCDLDTRKPLWENILLVGGRSLFPNFVERLLPELKKLAPDQTTPVINCPENRLFATWLGAATLAMGAEFFDLIITNEELTDEGEALFNTKCVN